MGRHEIYKSKEDEGQRTGLAQAALKNLFIHAIVKDQAELEIIRELGVRVIPFDKILADLARVSDLTGAAGTDITEIIHYFARHSQEGLHGSENMRGSKIDESS